MSIILRRNIVKIGFALVLFLQSLCYAQLSRAESLPTVPAAFKYVETPNFSPMDESSVIYQDSTGIIWIGTDIGLLSYDTNKTTLYANDIKKIDSISNNQITSIAEDSEGQLWVATLNGLNRFDIEQQKFFHYIIRPTSDQEYVNNRVYDVFVDSKGRVWAATATALYLYNKRSDTFISFRPWHIEYSFNNLDIWAYVIQEDPKGSIWLGTSAGGIIKFDPNEHHFTHFSSHIENKNKFPIDFINAIQVESYDELLVGTEIGLFRFNTRTLIAIRVLEEQINAPVTRLSKDAEGYWWMVVGTELVRLSPDLKTTKKRGVIESQRLANTQHKAKALFIDKENNIWTSFKDAGIHFLSSDLNRVQTVEFNQGNKFNNLTKINDVYVNSKKIWITTKQELSFISSDLKRKMLLRNIINNKQPLKKQEPELGGFYAIHETHQGDILVGRENGYSRVKNNGEIEHYPNGAKDHTSSIVEDYHKNIWMLAGEKGIQINRNLNNEHPFLIQQQKIISNDYSAAQYLFVSRDRQNIILYYKGYGLYRYSIKNNELNKFEGVDPLEDYINIQQTAEGNLVLFSKRTTATEVNIETGDVLEHHLPNEKTGCFISTSDGSSWYSQAKGGLLRVNTTSNEIDKLRHSEGIPALGMTGKHCIQTENGQLLFSSYEGLLVIDPSNDFRNKAKVSTIISQVVDSKKNINDLYSYQNSETISKQYVLELEMLYGETPLIFTFSVLSYSDIEANQFKYRVKELNNSWTETTSNTATLSYLPVGEFEFQVLGSNGDGVWSDLPAVVSLKVTPPFWLTWWAKFLYLIMAVLVIYSIFRSRTQAIRNRSKHFEEMVNRRTLELAKEKEIVEQLLAKKNDEFANVSHEFRTPLTLILGPIQNLLRSNIRSSTRKKLEMAKRNGYRLLRMVDQLLNMEKFKVQQIMSNQHIEVKPIAMLIAQSFKELAHEKNITMHIVKIDDVYIDFSVDAFEKILLNLLSNALKYTKSGGEIKVSILEHGDKQIQIKVQDTGLGIPKDRQQSVFERYNRVLDEHSEKITGAGIGLALVKELVEVHQGTVELESKLGVGSTFIVTLNAINSVGSLAPAIVNNEIIELELESIRGQDSTEQTAATQDEPNVDLTAENTTSDDISSENEEPSLSNSNKTTLLVIEDNPDMREYIIESLSDEYICLEAPNGKVGVSIAIRDIPDLIISDVMMPEMDGYQVSQILKEDEKTSHIPLILLTARGDKESRMRGWRKHADEYLTKPFDSDELNIRIENLLSIRNILRSRFAHEVIENQTSAPLLNAGMNEKDQLFIEKINECCDKNYADAEFETAKIAESVFMSERQLQRKLKALVDRSPSDYLRIFRLNKAKVKLREGGRVSNIALDVGFGSQAYFSKCFKAQFCMTAKQYQASGEEKF
jgi:signal transduction histidine kinase/CheY-like chemotaxis protein/ligand-binding sensor domain-containing protein